MPKFVKYKFIPDAQLVDVLPLSPSLKDIENEPMIHSASEAFAMQQGGPLTRAVLENLYVQEFIAKCPEGRHLVIDTRTLMLMPGMYPAIPGWHCDAVKRPSAVAQPDLEHIDPLTKHMALHFSNRYVGKGTISGTHFVRYPLTLDVDCNKVWGSVDEQVNQLQPEYTRGLDGELWQFGRDTLHRASATCARGWRWWIRLSYYHTPPKPQLRKQVQVYVAPSTGW